MAADQTDTADAPVIIERGTLAIADDGSATLLHAIIESDRSPLSALGPLGAIDHEWVKEHLMPAVFRAHGRAFDHTKDVTMMLCTFQKPRVRS